ncbi:MAG: DNA methyltransferase [Pseudomonadota bacterium]
MSNPTCQPKPGLADGGPRQSFTFAPKSGQTGTLTSDGRDFPIFSDEFWTAGQRQASSLHEISYRGCFKPQLPEFFIRRLTRPGDLVYDPFSGRGTTVIEAALLARRTAANDVNPLSRLLCAPRLFPPRPEEVAARLEEIDLDPQAKADIDLSMFYHPRTEGEIASLKNYLIEKADRADLLDDWIRMTATNRLTGHSKGFFSVYTLPPNQATSPERQVKINEKRNQQPEYRDVKALILKKTKSLLKKIGPAERGALAESTRGGPVFLENDAAHTPEIPSDSVKLTVTSPPFLDVVQYSADNWLRCWFNNLDAARIAAGITMARKVEKWTETMGAVFRELYRVAQPGGFVAFEVGEVKNRTVKLEEHVIPLGLAAGFGCHGVWINLQAFTKTSNIWGVGNNDLGTNTNRIVVFEK